MSYVYILKSLKNGKYYIGSTNDISQRFLTHQKGGVKATRYLRPFEIALQQECLSLSTARKIEQKLKKLKRRDYLDKIVKDGKIRLTGG